MRDDRAVDEKLFNVVAEGGPLHDVVQFVKEHEELELCFRGNSGNGNINIYYKNHLVFRIRGTSENPIVEISANQGRYTPNWREEYEKLGLDLSVVTVEKKNSNKNSSVEYVYSYKIEQGDYVQIIPKTGKYDLEFWNYSWSVLKGILDNYFSVKQNVDQYRKAFGLETVRSKDLKIEKQAQQRLFTKLNSCEKGFYFYDLEYMQKGDTSNNKNKPDALSIEYINGVATSLVYVEVKSKTSSIGGNSGLEKHLQGMYKYINESKGNGELKNRLTEVQEILDQYRKLEIRPVPHPFTEEEVQNLRKNQKMMLVLTDEAERDYKSKEEARNKIDDQIYAARTDNKIDIILYLENAAEQKV